MIVSHIANGELTIYLYNDIGGFGTTSDEVAEAVSFAADEVNTINVRINSYGGSVSDGWAMYNALTSSGKKVKTFNDGFCCSAALYPFLAGSERTANDLSVFFLHQCLGGGYGYAEDLRTMADEIDKMTEIGISAFTAVGMDADAAKTLMASETWLSADEAKSYGIATNVEELAENEAPAQSVRRNLQKLLLSQQKRNSENPAVDEPKQAEPQMVENKIYALWCK